MNTLNPQELTAKINHLRELRSKYQAVIDAHNEKIKDLQTKIWNYQIENDLLDDLHRKGRVGGKYFEELVKGYDQRNAELLQLISELHKLQENKLIDEKNMIKGIDSYIAYLEDWYGDHNDD